jgi:transposase-like protein
LAQHFLLTAAARTLSVVAVAHECRRGEGHLPDSALVETGGDPVCPACGCLAVYETRTRLLFKCKACGKQFSVTSGTIFHSRKLPVRDYLLTIAIFVNAATGMAALHLGRDLNVSHKTAFVVTHKLREAMTADQRHATAKGEAAS